MSVWLAAAVFLGQEVYMTEEEALRIVLPGAEGVIDAAITLDDETLRAVEHRLCRKVERTYLFYLGLRRDEVVGYAVVTEEVGKFLPIRFMVGVDPQGAVGDVAVLIHREAIGGDCRRRRYLDQFHGKTLNDPVRRNRDLLHVAGATMSCDGIARGVRKVLAVVQEFCINRPANVQTLRVQDRPLRVHERYLMGSLCKISAYGETPIVDEAIQAAFEEIKWIDARISHYREDSELSAINRRAARESVDVSAEVADFVRLCLGYSEKTQGAFDATVGPAVRAWGFFDGKHRVPTAKELEELKRMVSYKHVQVEGNAVRFAVEGVSLDPGAIGKGYAVDKAVEVLKKKGITAAMVDFGSTLYAMGAPPGQDAWSVGLRDPRKPDQLVGFMRFKDLALSISGSYEKFFERDGRRFTHILDPRTAAPVEGMLSTSVLCGSGAEADVLSTALFVLGPKKGIDLAKERGVEALFVPEDGSFVATKNWAQYFHEE